MLSRVVDHHWAVCDGTVQQLMPGSGWSFRPEVSSRKQNLVVRMVRGIFLEPGYQNIGIVFRSDAGFRNREIQSVERERSQPHVGVIVGESRNDCPTLKIDDFGLSGLSAKNLRIGPDRINASADDGQRLCPRSFWIAGVDVSVKQNRVTGKQRSPGKKDRNSEADADHATLCVHELLPE